MLLSKASRRGKWASWAEINAESIIQAKSGGIMGRHTLAELL